MKIKALVISAMLSGGLPYAAHSTESGPVVWMSYPLTLECPGDASLKVKVNSLSEPEADKPIAANIENLTGSTLAVDLILKQDAFEGRLSGYATGFNQVTLKTTPNYPATPPQGWLTVRLDRCVSKGSGK